LKIIALDYPKNIRVRHDESTINGQTLNAIEDALNWLRNPLRYKTYDILCVKCGNYFAWPDITESPLIFYRDSKPYCHDCVKIIDAEQEEKK